MKSLLDKKKWRLKNRKMNRQKPGIKPLSRKNREVFFVMIITT